MSCVLTVDVGNTTTNIGLFSIEHAEGPSPANNPEPTLLGSCTLTTPARITADEARIQLEQALTLMPNNPLDGVVLSCVVPTLTDPWRTALGRACSCRPLVIGPGIKTGVCMNYDDPAEVGPDRIADAVAARATYGAPVLAIDLGTTTNFEVIDEHGAFAGGIIAPGVALGARSLARAAARLPVIELRAPKRVIGRSTRAAMQSGVVLGEAARIDGLIDAVFSELGYEAPIALTGDGASSLAALLRHDVAVDNTLTLRGLALIWRANVK